MQKNLLLFLVMSLLCLTAHSSDAKFTQALKNCAPYSDSGSVTADGISATSTKKIVGWQGDKCVYKEQVSFSGITSDIVCRFSKSAINELASVIEAYELVQKYSGEKADFSSLESVEQTPVARVWQKYLTNPETCTITAGQN